MIADPLFPAVPTRVAGAGIIIADRFDDGILLFRERDLAQDLEEQAVVLRIAHEYIEVLDAECDADGHCVTLL